MSYNQTPCCVKCSRTRHQIDECGYTINDEWTCYGCIIKELESTIAALKEENERLQKRLLEEGESYRKQYMECCDLRGEADHLREGLEKIKKEWKAAEKLGKELICPAP